MLMAIAITLAPIHLSALRTLVPEFTKEKLLFLVGKDLMSDEDTALLAQAEAHQISDIEARALYTALNELHARAYKHHRASSASKSWFTSTRIAGLVAGTGLAAFLGLAVAGEKKAAAATTPVPRKPRPPAPPSDSIFVHKKYDTPALSPERRAAGAAKIAARLKANPPKHQPPPPMQRFVPKRRTPAQIAHDIKLRQARDAANGGQSVFVTD